MSFRQAVCRLIKGIRGSASLQTKVYNSVPNAGKVIVYSENGSGGHTSADYRLELLPWILLSGQAAFIIGTSSTPSMAEDVSTQSSCENGKSADDFSGFQKVEDGSVISNEYPSKWRVFTDNGRDYYSKGSIDHAERFFLSALLEAKEGFGERDPHVASSCNNLAELYKDKKDFKKAEPLYVEAVNILEEYFGVNDVRVGAALHNLGRFYFIQREFEKARVCYERVLKIKRHVLGEDHTEYADAMYHLGTVFYFQGKEKEAEDLLVDSVKILEAGGGHDQLILCDSRVYLAQIYTNSKRFAQAENLWRKVLPMMEVLKGWKSLDTITVAEKLASTLEETGRLKEAEKLLERCVDAWKDLLPHDHFKIAFNMLRIASIKMFLIPQQPVMDNSQALVELDKARCLLNDSIRISRKLLVEFLEQKGNNELVAKHRQKVVILLLQSFSDLGILEMLKHAYLGSREKIPEEANAALRLCISTFGELRSEHSISESPEVKAAYISCIRNMQKLITMQVKK